MRNAPSVSYPVGRCAFHGWLLVLISGLALLALLLLRWLWSGHNDLVIGSGFALWMLWTAAAAWLWWRTPVGHLRWDARATGLVVLAPAGGWFWQGDGQPPQSLTGVECLLDVQRFVLLRLRPVEQRSRWIWLEARRDPWRWDDLRRALRAHAWSAG